jgi:hypothetical protein
MVTAGKAALKDARFPQFASQIGSPTPRFAAPSASLTAAPPPAPEAPSSILEGVRRRWEMTLISAIEGQVEDGYSQLVRELQAEFRHGDVVALAGRIVESEAADFYWEARVRERYLGQHFDFDGGSDEAGEELARVAMLSFFARRWHVGACLVDGEGRVAELLWRRSFEELAEAEAAFTGAR